MASKERNVALCIIFSIITCGIYGLYWFATITDDLKAISGDDQTAPGVKAVIFTIITCGLYGIYWIYKRGENMDTITGKRNTGVIYLILYVLGLSIIPLILMQLEINKHA